MQIRFDAIDQGYNNVKNQWHGCPWQLQGSEGSNKSETHCMRTWHSIIARWYVVQRRFYQFRGTCLLKYFFQNFAENSIRNRANKECNHQSISFPSQDHVESAGHHYRCGGSNRFQPVVVVIVQCWRFFFFRHYCILFLVGHGYEYEYLYSVACWFLCTCTRYHKMLRSSSSQKCCGWCWWDECVDSRKKEW